MKIRFSFSRRRDHDIPHTNAQLYIEQIMKTAQQSSKIDPKIKVGIPTMRHPQLVQTKVMIRARTPEIVPHHIEEYPTDEVGSERRL